MKRMLLLLFALILLAVAFLATLAVAPAQVEQPVACGGPPSEQYPKTGGDAARRQCNHPCAAIKSAFCAHCLRHAGGGGNANRFRDRRADHASPGRRRPAGRTGPGAGAPGSVISPGAARRGRSGSGDGPGQPHAGSNRPASRARWTRPRRPCARPRPRSTAPNRE